MMPCRTMRRNIARIVEQELDLHWFGRGRIDKLHVLDTQPALVQQLRGMQQVFAGLPRAVAHRIPIRCREYIFRYFVLHRPKDFELLALWQPGAGELGTLKIAGDTLVLSVENIFVDSLEIEGKVEGPPHSRNFTELARRMLNAKACMIPRLRIGNSSEHDIPFLMAGKP